MVDYESQHRELREAIMSVAGKFPGEWRNVGRCLGLSEAIVQGIVSDHVGNTSEMQHQMLLRWKEKEGSLATLSALANALRRAGRKDLAETLEKGKSPNAFANKKKSSSSDNKTDAEQENYNKIVRPVIYFILLPVAISCIAYFMITNYGIYDRNHELNGRKTYSAGTQKMTDDVMEPDQLENAVFYVKNELTTQWRDVGRSLGLSHADIEHIKDEYGNKPKERNYQMLQKWREQKGKHATLEVLLDALRKAKRGDLADNLLKEIQKEDKEVKP